MKIRLKTLLVSLALPIAGGALSAFLTKSGMADFARAAKPPLSPPSWLFPAVWALLYTLMGVACYAVAVSENKKSPAALKAYGAQLFFNFAWTFLFFDFKAYLLAALWLAALIALAILTAVRFWRISKPAGIMLLPYIAWLLFAEYLNTGIALLN